MKNLKILIIDHDALSMDLLGTIFAHFGVETIQKCLSGEEGIEKHKSTQADIIFIEQELPSVSALELAKTLKEISAKTSVVLVSDTPTADVVNSALENGADGFLAKPYSADNVTHTIRHLEKNKES